LSNGLGGYSSSTIIGANTRKYHGLLISPIKPPWSRKLLLSKLEEEILSGEEKFQLSTNEYPGVIHPKGYKHQWQFRINPLPTFLYMLRDLIIKKTIFMPHKKNAVIINYKVSKYSCEPGKIRLYPLVNSRGIHEVLGGRRTELEFKQQAGGKLTQVIASYPGAPSLFIGSDLMSYRTSELPEEKRWFRNMEYPRERERGYEYHEDHYNPGFFELELKSGPNEFNVLAVGGPEAEKIFDDLYSENPEDFARERVRALQRLEGLTKSCRSSTIREDHRWRYLVWAADSFIAEKEKIIAGYHWFSTWGRDSLIALPGLTLVTGRYDTARKVMLMLEKYRKNGLIPSRFGSEWSEFNGADVPLLFIYSIYKYLAYTDDRDLANRLWTTLEEIVNDYANETNEKIRMDEDGLIWSDEGMTWMDARVDGRCVTPRQGKTVEVNALWYNALRIKEIIAEKIGKENGQTGLAKDAKKNFRKEFWNPKRECLYDVVGDLSDARVRPNQIFAVGLPFKLINGKEEEGVISIVRDKLLTPYGLRGLEREDPNYQGVYEGDLKKRDLAYHQGTVWSWLIGPFVTALTRSQEGSKENEFARRLIGSLLNNHLRDTGLGTISEIFDGNEPHTPRGCISQAWSVGEILRCYVEDIEGRRPPFEKDYV
jgi:predicted glycogen debranching enzyme